MDKKKLTGGLAGLLAVMLYGGSEVLDLSARLSALEALHPELVTDVPDDAAEVHDVEPTEAPEDIEEAPEGESTPEATEEAPEPAEELEVTEEG
tara:strand:- start:195 stop:476 length:282 start_codon:yes stop_codon:yes gene_type:complete